MRVQIHAGYVFIVYVYVLAYSVPCFLLAFDMAHASGRPRSAKPTTRWPGAIALDWGSVFGHVLRQNTLKSTYIHGQVL